MDRRHRRVDARLATRLVAAQFPELAGATLEPFGVGFDNAAFLADGRVVFRFPRRRIVAGSIEREVAVLPHLALHLPLPIPSPRYVGAPSADYPWTFAGYDLIAEIGGRDDSVCVSSEEFDDLPRFTERFRQFHQLLVDAGYLPVAIVHLRPQVDYFEALYDELIAGGWRIRVDDFYADVLSARPADPDRLSYDRFLDRIAGVFGRDNVVVRAYQARADNSRVLLRDFTALLAPNIEVGTLRLPPRLNQRRTPPVSGRRFLDTLVVDGEALERQREFGTQKV